MIASIIRWSVVNRFFVLLATAAIVVGGLYSIKNTPVDALPDLSDVQVIIKSSFPGQAPQVVQAHSVSSAIRPPTIGSRASISVFKAFSCFSTASLLGASNKQNDLFSAMLYIKLACVIPNSSLGAF